MNLADFLHADTIQESRKLFSNYWVGMVKYGHGHLGHGTYKYAVSQ